MECNLERFCLLYASYRSEVPTFIKSKSASLGRLVVTVMSNHAEKPDALPRDPYSASDTSISCFEVLIELW